MAQLVKNLPAMRETSVQSLGWEDPLEKGKATHSSILAWRILCTVQSMGLQRVGHDFHFHLEMSCQELLDWWTHGDVGERGTFQRAWKLRAPSHIPYPVPYFCLAVLELTVSPAGSLEKEMANHSSILAWRIPWTEEPGRRQSMGSQELDTT